MTSIPWDTEDGEIMEDDDNVITGLSPEEEVEFLPEKPVEKRLPKEFLQPRWGIKYRTYKSPQYKVVDSNFNVNNFQGSFKLVSAVNVPSCVRYFVNGYRVKEISQFGDNNRMISKYSMPRGIQVLIREGPLQPELSIVKFCYIHSLLKKKAVVDNMMQYIYQTTPTTFPAIIQEENSTWSGPFPSNVYNNRFPASKELWKMFCNFAT